MSSSEEPTVITLDNTNSIQILAQYIEHAQQKGAYLLNEAEILKRAVEVLLNNVHDNELNESNSKSLLVQGVHKGQRHGAYTLNDASLLSKVVNFVTATEQPQQNPPVPDASEQQNLVKHENVSEENTNIDDLSDLAEPIPLKPKEV
jgi:uncharacterized protein YifE (UPF0438 family)